MATEQTTNPNWNSNTNNSYASSAGYGWQEQNQQTFLQNQEQRINLKSAEQARTYLATHQADESKMTFDKIFLVYKFNATFQRTLTTGMESMDSLEQARQYFNKAALMIHPDKNSHPLAEPVFKKLRESFDTAKATLKQRSQLFQHSQPCSTSSQAFNCHQDFYHSTATN